MQISDQELIVGYLSGHKKNLDALVNRYLKLVYSVAFYYVKNSPDAEDIAQDVFIKVMANLNKFDLSKPFKPWISRITKNQALDLLKKKKMTAFSALTEDDEYLINSIPDPSPSMEQIISTKENVSLVTQAIKKLPVEQQVIFYLRYAKGLGYKEIAERVGGVMNTVKSKSRRSILSLKKALDLPKI